MPEGYITWQEMGIDFLYHGTYKEGVERVGPLSQGPFPPMVEGHLAA